MKAEDCTTAATKFPWNLLCDQVSDSAAMYERPLLWFVVSRNDVLESRTIWSLLMSFFFFFQKIAHNYLMLLREKHETNRIKSMSEMIFKETLSFLFLYALLFRRSELKVSRIRGRLGNSAAGQQLNEGCLDLFLTIWSDRARARNVPGITSVCHVAPTIRAPSK